MAYMLTRTVVQSRRAGSMAALGIKVGSCLHLAAAVVCLSALLLGFGTAITILKWALAPNALSSASLSATMPWNCGMSGWVA